MQTLIHLSIEPQIADLEKKIAIKTDILSTDIDDEIKAMMIDEVRDNYNLYKDYETDKIVHVAYAKRKENIINEYGEIENESIDKRIKEKDKRRKLYYKTYTGREFGDVKNYHIALDSSTLGVDTCIDILYKIIEG